MLVLVVNIRRVPFSFSILLALAMATFATVVYAEFGVDDLKFDYLIIFYKAAPAIAVAAAAACLATVLPFPSQLAKDTGVLATTLACLAAWVITLRRPEPNAIIYSRPGVAPLASQIHAMEAPPHFVLDLSSRTDWGAVWGSVVGVEIIDMRSNTPSRFCIGANWHILFTDKMKCREEESLEQVHYLAEVPNAGWLADATPTARSELLNLYRVERPCLTAGKQLAISDDLLIFSTYILGAGWSPPEHDFVWSEGTSSTLHVCLDTGVTKLGLDLSAYLPIQSSRQTVTILVDGNKVTSFNFDPAHNSALRWIDLPPRNNTMLSITFAIADPISPRQATGSPDARLLGVALKGLEVR
jgi:hypothetical protein